MTGPEITLDISPDVERFETALTGDDEIGAIVRCHFEIEQALIHVMGVLAASPLRPEHERWNFATKVDVCGLLGVPDSHLAPVKTLNKHRNQLAHSGSDKIDIQWERDLRNQVKALMPIFTDAFKLQYNDKNGEPRYLKTLGEMSVRERYVSACMVLWAALAAFPKRSGRAI